MSAERPIRRRTVLWLELLLFFLIILTVSGCAARNAQDSASYAPMGMPMSEEAQAGQIAQDSDGIPSGDTTSALLNRRLIARATLDMVVADTGAALTKIDALLEENGGFISNASIYGDNSGSADPSQQYGNLTLRVPAENLESMLDALAALAVRVRTRSVNREDITDQYTDIEAQLRTLSATEEELFAMLQEVRERPDATPDDILAVHSRLMEIRGQIEQVQGRKQMFDNLVALSTIDVSLVPDSSTAPLVEEGWQPGSVLRDATRALVSGLQSLGTFFIWLVVYALPLIVLFLLPIVIVILIIRWLWRRSRRRRAARAEVTVSPSEGEVATTPPTT